MSLHTLTDLEFSQLGEANKLLTEITRKHSVACECMLCQARCYTDVQDQESRQVEYHDWNDRIVVSDNGRHRLRQKEDRNVWASRRRRR